ncbi:Putative proline dehydrogenase domain, proline oxidase family, FAD-linked oxidoreductase [Septoria linicola]|uniref:Proline dehydrogenase n=1 Tax=Septoria linicola TaxID=215465 RepID=A0A9Q9EPA4_9PEZI|nr:Putative proline dehydrogenase domain, proline oxidase family, FAD-linked oxidoreductase [Septoria linicola]
MTLKPAVRFSARITTNNFQCGRFEFQRAISTQGRNRSSTTASSNEDFSIRQSVDVTAQPSTTPVHRPLKSLPMPALLRSIFLGQLFASPMISNLGLNVLGRLANARSPLLDVDRNRFLNRLLRAVVYNHFCGGANKSEIAPVLDRLKRSGYAGVILQYAREIVTHGRVEDSKEDVSAQHIQMWLDGNLQTLSCLGKGDYMGLKYTGAGKSIADALKADHDPPAQFNAALHEILRAAQAQGTRIFLDAEQQDFQAAIDRWTVDLMRQYNVNGEVLVLNTYQAYLKASRSIIRDHLKLARQEGWHLGVKLVRGAYILNDIRTRIHDTKADTDASYNGIVRSLLLRSYDDIGPENFPKVRTFLAGHNAESIQRAAKLHKDLVLQGCKPATLEFGQLYGMADHVSGELLQQVEDAKLAAKDLTGEAAELQKQAAPRVFKCVNWGTVRECIHFLMRRAAENQGSADRLRDGVVESRRELWARLLGQ